MKKQTAVDWFFDKIKSHFEHDGDLFETLLFTYSIAKQKEKELFINNHIEVMKIGLINEGDAKWNDAYSPKIKETALKYYEEAFSESVS